MTHQAPQPSDDNSIPLDQYAATLRSLVDACEQLRQLDFCSGITWTIRCTSECFAPEDGTFDRERAGDVVTALSWMFVRFLTSLEDGPSALDQFIDEVRSTDLPELEAQHSVQIPAIDMDAICAIADLDFDLGDLCAATDAGAFEEFLASELRIAEQLKAMDAPDFIERLARGPLGEGDDSR